jgi:hypothetical protein
MKLQIFEKDYPDNYQSINLLDKDGNSVFNMTLEVDANNAPEDATFYRDLDGVHDIPSLARWVFLLAKGGDSEFHTEYVDS